MLDKEELLVQIEKLKKELKVEKNRIKKADYGLVWLDVPEAFEDDAENKLPILEEVKDKAITNNDGNPTHILIEGDNYHALTCLNYTHKGKIDLIYIDPPYNTGSDGFIYKDKRVLDKFPDGTDVPKDHPLRHSYWLSFMSKRLELARDLLKDDGVIFISIDDNEFANLKLLSDKVFREKNFIGCVSWFKKRKGSFLSNKLVSLTEYILVYSKTPGVRLFGSKTDNTESQPIVKRTNAKKILEFPAGIVQSKLKDGNYNKGVYGKGSSATNLLNDIVIKEGIIVSSFSLEAPFTWGQDFLDNEIKDGTIILINTLNFQPRVIRVNNNSYKALPSFLDGREFSATNEDAYELLRNIFKVDRPFSYSKPVSLIKQLISSRLHFENNLSVLDFFAGSATTLQACLKLNNEGANIQNIICTNNEGNICQDVTYPRAEKVINGYKNLKGLEIEPLGNSLKYYKTSFVGNNNILSANDKDKTELAQKAGCLLSIAENTLDEVEHTSHFQFFKSNDRNTAIYFQEDLSELDAFVNKVEKLENPTTVYLFSWGNKSEFESMFDHIPNINIKTIPQPILEIYMKIYNINN
jgi:adenine-specific DNA-methyltransferase